MNLTKRSKPSPFSSSSSSSEKSGQLEPLLPGLPDHLSHLCLSPLPPSLLFSVCRSWRRFLRSPACPPYPTLYALLSKPEPDPNPIEFASYDPISSTWASLPPPPLGPHLLHLSHPSFIARRLPVQSAAARGRLILVAGTTRRLSPALSRPLVFDPSTSLWRTGPAFPSPRRWCAVGSAGSSLYVASGVASKYSSDLARSVERWDLGRAGSGWEPLAQLRDGRFSREPIEMVASGGRLCMVSAREGAVYEIGSDRWSEMPPGLLAGWTGPAAVVDEGGPIYVADESRGVLRRYEWGADTWTVVALSEALRGAAAMAGGGGRVCVACAGGSAVAVFDVERGLTWTVPPPEGRRVVALHVLPRVASGES